VTVLVLVEHADGAPSEVSLQAVALGRSARPGADVHAVLIGGAEAAPALAGHGVSTAHVAEHESLDAFAPDAWARVVNDLAAQVSAGAIVAAGTERGNDVLARVAARIGEPFAANVVSVTPGQPLALTRVRWGGSLLEEARLHGGTLVLTAAPHAVAAAEEPVELTVERFTPSLDAADLVVQVREHVPPAGGGISLADAKVVVSGGRGVGSAEGFAIVEELAGLLEAAVGCSRAVTMAGWRPHTFQVGQTGTKIAPQIYIPCGISGATQHVAGCKGAKRILAINKDREAPIMSVADYAVIGDVHEVVPAISAEIRRVRGG
jgi:electron transfer flavoprotein alpha subunit